MTLNMPCKEKINASGSNDDDFKSDSTGEDHSAMIGKKINNITPGRSLTQKPHVPPKPASYNLKSDGRHTIPNKKIKDLSDYFEAMPVESQNFYDSAVPVSIDKLEDYCSQPSHEPDALESNESVYDIPIAPKSSSTKLSSRSKDVEASGEVSDEDEDNLNADYIVLQKFKNQQRASWIEKVETMSRRDVAEKDEMIHPNSWNTQQPDDDDSYEISGSLADGQKNWMDLRLNILNDMVKDEKSYAKKLKAISEKSFLLSSCEPSLRKNLELTLEVIKNLLYLHQTFGNDLLKAVSTSGEQNIGRIIKSFVQEEFIQAREYTVKYRECTKCTSKQKMQSLDGLNKKKDDPTETSDSKSYDDLKQENFQTFMSSLSLPIWRFQNYIHTLQRLIKYTSPMHPDFDHLSTALQLAKQFFNDLSIFPEPNVPLRYLVKKALVVEQMDNMRKLRCLFLFNDVLICAKQRINKLSVRWFHPLHQLCIDDKQSIPGQRSVNEETMDALKKSLIKCQADYTTEFKKTDPVEKRKKLEPLKKKLMELETELVLNSPYLSLVLTSPRRTSTILLSSDYEREDWKVYISNFVAKAKGAPCKMSLAQANLLINELKILQPSCQDDVFQSSRIDGLLKLTIHKFLGLETNSKVYCTVEVDSFGHFFLKAKTTKVLDLEPEWNEDFDIELEGANTMRIMCYRVDQGTDVQLGSTALELNEAWLKEKFVDENVPISTKMFLKISVEYQFPNVVESLKSNSIMSRGGTYFGVPLGDIPGTEDDEVPLLLTSCLGEIERRGMKDTGLYRVSGLSSEIQKLKASFNKNPLAASSNLKGVDTNVLTGTVKLFLRELPDPLFPSSKYHDFIKCLWHTPSLEEKLRQNMAELPSPNFETIVYLLKHLARVSEQEASNKMSLGNLATIFGPSLMRNPLPTKSTRQEHLLTQSTSDIAHQCEVLLALLTQLARGATFTGPPQPTPPNSRSRRCN